MPKRGLVIPTVSAIQDRNVQAAFQSIMSWARNVDDNYVARGDLNLPNSPVVQQVVNNIQRLQTAAAQKASAQAAAAAAEQNRKIAAQVVRNILQNSGTEPPIEMKAPQIFVSRSDVTRTYIGAGGIGGGVVDAGDPRGYIPTWGFDSSDGSTFMGKDTVPDKQITFDATAGVLTVGADVRINMAGYPTLSETYDTASLAYSNASSALSGLTAKLNKSAGDTLSGQVSFASAGAMQITSGTVSVASDGTVSGTGSGVLFTQKGIVCIQGGTVMATIPISGSPVFGGQLSAATGSFAGSIYTAETVYAAGSHSTGYAATLTGLNSYTTGIGVYGAATHASGLCTGVRGVVTSTNANSRGVDGYSQYGIGVRGIAAGTGVGILAGNDGGASALSLQVKTKALFEGVVDIQSSLQCDSLRIDQSPSAGSATATFPGNNKPGGNSTCSWLSLNLNGTTYYLPAWT